MKKLFLLVVFIATSFVQTAFAQHEHNSERASTLISLYFNIKDALVADNEILAASNAGEFVKALNTANEKTVNKASSVPLLEHAGMIAESKDLKSQREHFAGLSAEMIALTKTAKLSAEPVYQQYCPMEKANWLSSEKAIKNPYYGSSMLTCGKVIETIK